MVKPFLHLFASFCYIWINIHRMRRIVCKWMFTMLGWGLGLACFEPHAFDLFHPFAGIEAWWRVLVVGVPRGLQLSDWDRLKILYVLLPRQVQRKANGKHRVGVLFCLRWNITKDKTVQNNLNSVESIPKPPKPCQLIYIWYCDNVKHINSPDSEDSRILRWGVLAARRAEVPKWIPEVFSLVSADEGGSKEATSTC